MMRPLFAAAAVAGSVMTVAPAQACAVHRPLDIAGVRSADAVVVGRALNYRQPTNHSASFELIVDEVMRGRVGRRLAVRLPITLYGAPRSLPRGRLLIALHLAGTPPGMATVMQGPCSPPFILEAGGAQAVAARRLLAQPRR